MKYIKRILWLILMIPIYLVEGLLFGFSLFSIPLTYIFKGEFSNDYVYKTVDALDAFNNSIRPK